MAQSQAQINADIITKVLTGGSNTRAVGMREILNDITGSYINKVDGGVMQAVLSYATEIALPDRKMLAYVGYIDDALAELPGDYFPLEATADVNVEFNGAWGVNYNDLTFVNFNGTDQGDFNIDAFTNVNITGTYAGDFDINGYNNLTFEGTGSGAFEIKDYNNFLVDVKDVGGDVNIFSQNFTVGGTPGVYKGIEYEFDCSAQYSNRSLIDLEYFNNNTTTADNGLTKTGNNIALGGVLTGNTTINTGLNIFEIVSEPDYSKTWYYQNDFATYIGYGGNGNSNYISVDATGFVGIGIIDYSFGTENASSENRVLISDTQFTVNKLGLIEIASKDNNVSLKAWNGVSGGVIEVQGGSDYKARLSTSTLLSNIDINFPNASGTLALTSDLTFANITGKPTTIGGYGIIDTTAQVLTGLNITGGSIVAADSILSAFGKVQNQVSALVSGVTYQGVWNATTNAPTLTSSVGTNGFYYIVNVAGSTNLDGITAWQIGDWAIFTGGAWQKVDNTDAVSSVNGFTGAVSLTTTDISEGTNLYFTNARAISSTLTGYASGPGTITFADSVLGAIQKLNGNIGINIVRTNQANNFTALGQRFVSGSLEFRNPAGTYSYTMAHGAILAQRQITLPLLTNNDTFVFEAHAQTLTNKTINLTDNTITATGAALGDIIKHNGTKYVLLAKGTANQVLKVNSLGTDVEFGNAVVYTEAMQALVLPPSGVWTVTTVPGAPINAEIDIVCQNTAGSNRTIGVRQVGSGLVRSFIVGSNSSIVLLCKTNNLGEVELFTSGGLVVFTQTSSFE